MVVNSSHDPLLDCDETFPVLGLSLHDLKGSMCSNRLMPMECACGKILETGVSHLGSTEMACASPSSIAPHSARGKLLGTCSLHLLRAFVYSSEVSAYILSLLCINIRQLAS